MLFRSVINTVYDVWIVILVILDVPMVRLDTVIRRFFLYDSRGAGVY